MNENRLFQHQQLAAEDFHIPLGRRMLNRENEWVGRGYILARADSGTLGKVHFEEDITQLF